MSRGFLKFLLCCYIMVCGYCLFPLEWNVSFFSLFISKSLLYIASYGMVAIWFIGLNSRVKSVLVYLETALLTAVGLAIHYLIEYGEWSISINYSLRNILLYLTITPLFVSAFHYFVRRHIRIPK